MSQRAGAAAAALRGALTPPAGRPPGPRPPASSKFTCLLDQDAALAYDRLVLALRGRLGRQVHKAEVLRALIALAAEDESLVDLLAAEVRWRRDGATT